jgi:hypothetical protein
LGTADTSGFTNAGSTCLPSVVIASQSWVDGFRYLNPFGFEGLPSNSSGFALRQAISFFAQQGPGYTRIFVSQGDSSNVFIASAT